MNRSGKMTIEPRFYYANHFSNGLAIISLAKYNTKQTYGLIDKKGEIVIEPLNNDVNHYSEGMVAVKVGDKWGFENKNNETVVELWFEKAGVFSNETLLLLFIPIFIGCSFFSSDKDDTIKDRLIFLPILLSSTPCEKDCPYYNTKGDGIYGSYSLSINGNTNLSNPQTVETFDMDTYTWLKIETRKVFSYQDALLQSSKVSARITELTNLISNSPTTAGERNTYYAEREFLQKKKTEMKKDFEEKVYPKSYNTFLIYDGSKKVEIYTETVLQYSNPSNPKTPITSDPIYIKLDDLSSTDIGTSITLSKASTGKIFIIEDSGKRYSSEYTNSNLSITIANIPSTGNTTTITISGTLYQSNDSLESIPISGNMQAYRISQ